MAEENKRKRASLKVAGVTGNTDYGYGSLDTGEYLTKLRGQQGSSIYDEMRRSDPQVKSVLSALSLPIRRAKYRVDPGGKTKKDKEIAEIIETNLFEEMSLTWDDTIRHALLMLPFGFSILEKVYEFKDGLFKLRKLDPRLPMSIVRWEYDKTKRKLVGPVQQDTDGNEYSLPIEKLSVFISEREGDNWEGISVLRAAYKPWFIKGKLEKINAIKHDRHGVGIPRAKVPPNVKENSAEWNQAEEMLENLYANEKSYIIQPDGWEFDLLDTSSNKTGTDVLPSIKYCDEMISKAVLAMFIDLGTTNTGSRALGVSFIELFLQSLQTFADYICEIINRFVIREYVDFNWYVEEYPKLMVGKIEKLDTQIIAIMQKAGVLSADEGLENAVRDELNLPELEKDKLKKIIDEGKDGEPSSGSTDNDPKDGENGGESVNNSPTVADPVKIEDDKKQLNTPLKFKDLKPEEGIPNLIDIELRLNSAEESLAKRILDIRKDQARDIIMQIVAGRQVQNVRVIEKRDQHKLLMSEYKMQIKRGRQEVREEMAAQKKRLNEEPEDYRDYIDMANEKFSIEVEGAGDKLKNMMLLLALDYRRQGLGGSALESALLSGWEGNISTQTWDNMSAGAVNGGWGAGRDIEARKWADDIEYAYYSSVLDKNTCIWCNEKDGIKHAVGDPNYVTPNPECAGGNKCRCITVYVHKAENIPTG